MRYRRFGNTILPLTIALIAGCAPGASSLGIAAESHVAPNTRRTAPQCSVPVAVPEHIHVASLAQFRVLSGPYEVATNSSSLLITHVGQTFVVHVLEKPLISARVTVTDKASGAQASFFLTALPSARQSQVHPSEVCPHEPAVIPTLLTDVHARFRLEGGPYTAEADSNELALSLSPTELSIHCSKYHSPACRGKVTVSNPATGATLGFNITFR